MGEVALNVARGAAAARGGETDVGGHDCAGYLGAGDGLMKMTLWDGVVEIVLKHGLRRRW